MTFKKGQSGYPKGRPKGIIDKRMRLNKALMGNADALLAVATAKALEGDPQMLTTLLSRLMPTLKPEGAPVQFALDTSLPTSKQLEQILQAVANGQLTIEKASEMARVITSLADVRAIENSGGDGALVAAFKQMAQAVSRQDSMPVPEAPPPVDEE
jgi:Family of unknown function (DUF5681)